MAGLTFFPFLQVSKFVVFYFSRKKEWHTHTVLQHKCSGARVAAELICFVNFETLPLLLPLLLLLFIWQEDYNNDYNTTTTIYHHSSLISSSHCVPL